MSRWLFLRGAWDERSQKSIDDHDDAWISLFSKLSRHGHGDIVFFSSDHTKSIEYKPNCTIWKYKDLSPVSGEWDYIFYRGGFKEYETVRRNCKGYSIYYGAGRRYMPDGNYDLCLVDSESQLREVVAAGHNGCLFEKPAAPHFRPIDCERDYDVCFIANGQQAAFKGVQWVYDTCPRDIKVLHLGYPSRYTIPENVTQVRVDRKDMPQWIGRCKVGIVPYWNQIDSGPRALVEMAACGLVSVVADELNFYREKYEHVLSDHDGFWDKVRFRIALDGDRVRRKPQNTGVEYCANNLMFYTAT